MKTVRISAGLEKRLRASQDPLAIELVELLDQPKNAKPAGGLSYTELVRQFRDALGGALALPPNPSVGWIVRQVNKAREIGLDGEAVARICELARAKYPKGALELEFLLRIATRLLAEAAQGEETGRPTPGTVVTGRGAQDD